MPQMYRVDYITNHAGGMVETGKVIVLAESQEEAHKIVAAEQNLPPSRTRFDATKIKPPCYPVETNQAYAGPKTSVRARGDAPLVPSRSYHVVIDAIAHGRYERQVLYKVAEDLHARAAGRQSRHNVSMAITCQAAGPQASPRTGMGAIETYRPATKPIQGGRVR
jgi:hypothetical protein